MGNTEELGLEVFVEGWREFENIMDRLDKSIDGLEDEMQKTTKTSGAFSVALGTLAANAVAKLGEIIVDVGRKVIDFTLDSVDMAADFQSSMAVLSVAASSTGLTFDELKAAALAVGGDTRLLGVSATGAAESLTGLFKAGLTNVEVFGDLNAFMNEGAELGGALRASIDLAAATELDMVQASDLAAIALASFGSELETEGERAVFVTDAMDNFVKAADASVAEVGDLAAALVNVGPTAAALGISLEDTNNALAILSTRGISGAQAGTALKSMITNLQRPTEQVQEKFRELGVSLFDAEGEFVGLRQLTLDLSTAMAGMTDEQRNQTVQMIAGTFGMNAMNTLLAEGVDGWDAMAAATENAAGIQEQAAVRGQTFNAQMESLEGTIETVKIGIGDALLPVATELAQWFNEMVSTHGPALTEWLGTNIPIAIESAKKFFLETLLPAFEAARLFVVNNLIPAIVDIVAWLSANLPGAIETAKTFWEGTLRPALVTVWDFIVNSLIPAIGDVVAWLSDNIPIAIEAAATFWEETLRPALETVWKFIQDNVIPIIKTVVEWLQVNIPVAIETARKFWEETLKPALETVWKFIQDEVIPIFKIVVTWLEENIPVALEAAALIWEETLKPALETVWKFISEDLLPLFEAIVELFNVALTKALEAISGIWEKTLKPALKTVWEFIDQNLLPILKDIAVFFETTLKTAMEEANPILEGIKGVFEAIGKAVGDVVAFIKDLTEKIKAIKLPDWMDPGSPTPLEIGLRGIAGAMQEVAALSGGMFAGAPSGITVGAAGGGGAAPTARPGTQVTNNITNNNEGNEFNLNTNTLMQPGQLSLEFSTFAMASR